MWFYIGRTIYRDQAAELAVHPSTSFTNEQLEAVSRNAKYRRKGRSIREIETVLFALGFASINSQETRLPADNKPKRTRRLWHQPNCRCPEQLP